MQNRVVPIADRVLFPGSWLQEGPFTVFDVETTGLSPVTSRIVELAAVRVELDGTQSAFYALIHPRCKIPFAVRMVHGISDDMVADAPPFHEIAPRFLAFIKGSTLIAHNAMFDLGFLQESLARCGQPLFKGKTVDTLRLYRTVFPHLSSHKLQALRQHFHFGSGREIAHSAMGDVQITLEAFAYLMNQVQDAQKKDEDDS